MGFTPTGNEAITTGTTEVTAVPAPSANQRHICTEITIYTADTATPSADGFDDDGRLEVSFYILPPPSVALVMNSNNVEIHVGHDASDVLDHYIEVYVGKTEPAAFSPV